ncbi:hypothetical protein RSK20926_07457 [Roseobacter sp. SK209-2-6]|uniref:DUF2459 domain-containing protein n=1 Tax=Roseobacter sp. SK209-2-6 TaxID=388739 RepID=UPI0000F3D8CE|nr:DUF2459 domain-containing protein [Roseobacter sp. SK209-2-6]EBA17556.1 hypothetical protein RSK20926_07457 [Roseobacter sp. SK209-2-6]
MIYALARALRWPVGLLAAYFLAALLGAVLPAGQETTAPWGRPYRVLLAAGPIHYDFLIPLDAPTKAYFALLEPVLPELNHSEAAWLVLGWGAKDFYTTSGDYGDITLKAIGRGLFGDSSVLRADVLGRIDPHLDLPEIAFSEGEYAAFLKALDASFARGSDGVIQVLQHPGLTQSDRFFEARGRFHLFRTCNTWIARMIRASGRRFGLWTPTPYSVTLSHALYLAD